MKNEQLEAKVKRLGHQKLFENLLAFYYGVCVDLFVLQSSREDLASRQNSTL